MPPLSAFAFSRPWSALYAELAIDDAVMAESGIFPFSIPKPAIQVGGLGVENPARKKGRAVLINAIFFMKNILVKKLKSQKEGFCFLSILLYYIPETMCLATDGQDGKD